MANYTQEKSYLERIADALENIEPAVSGNIEITENGENINVAPYATATVNVSGGGGIRKCTVTVQNTSANTGYVRILSLDANGCLTYDSMNIAANETVTLYYMIGYNQQIQGYEPLNFWDSFSNADFEGAPPVFTNLVNTTVNAQMQPLITDPTTDASFTVRFGFTSEG